jgi:HD superfamily phosphodiesterase
MQRIEKIQSHPLYRDLVERLATDEQNRRFCRHTTEHFLDVARLMYIFNLEDGAGIRKDIIYATALLHDLGRPAQNREGTPHDIAGAQIAGEILPECGYNKEETQEICQAILGHRTAESMHCPDRLTAYLYLADKQSRNCFSCPVSDECNWPKEKKNLRIKY